jgi:hypothetical protein
MSDQAPVQSPEERLENLLGDVENDIPEDEDEEVPEPEEGDSEEPAEDSQEQPEEDPKLKLKRGDEEVEVSAEEAKNLAQQGWDYTQKTQKLADDRKQVEAYAQALKAQEQSLREQATMQQAYIKDIAKVESLNDQIAQYEKVDWNALSDSDPVQVQKLWIQYQNLQNQRTQASNEIQTKHYQLQTAQEQQRSVALEAARADLLKTFPDWGEAKATELRETAKSYGFSDQELSGITDPRTVKVLADAASYRKLQAQKPNVTNKITGKPPVVKPGSKDTKQSAARQEVGELKKTFNKSRTTQNAAALLERML